MSRARVGPKPSYSLIVAPCPLRDFLSGIVFLALTFALPISPYAAPRTLVAKVERVSDGDTLVALTANSTKLRLRLLGIDAQEVPHGDIPVQPFGEEARDPFSVACLRRV